MRFPLAGVASAHAASVFDLSARKSNGKVCRRAVAPCGLLPIFSSKLVIRMKIQVCWGELPRVSAAFPRILSP